VSGPSERPEPVERAEREPYIDIHTAHAARVYDFLSGGEVNFAVDREVAEIQARAYGRDDGTRARRDIRTQREFIGKVVGYCTTEGGVRQFLDIGSGIPSQDHLHRLAQQAAPDARMVFVDKDDIVLAHAHQLLPNTDDAAARFVQADFFEPDTVLRAAAETLDFTQPIALLLIALTHLHGDELHPHETVARYVDALPSGSYLAMTNLSSDIEPEATEPLKRAMDGANIDYGFALRSKAEFARFFEGLDLVEPGIVPVSAWHAEVDFVAPVWSAVARKP
jgi:hypothetical protein